MQNDIERIRCFRNFLLRQIEGLSPQQLNRIPEGYNNNIIWNIGHMTAALQNMCYGKAGLPFAVEDRYLSPFISGTKPLEHYDEQEIAEIKNRFMTSIDQLELDYEKNLFSNYSQALAVRKVYGVEVNNIDEAISYLLYHEGFHSGCILSLKHLV